jgi:phage antirepressor YoqD-like protein
MSLVDLKSDLSKFRQTVSKEEKDSPASSKATDANNFATLQPISDRLAQLRPSIGEWKTAPIESLLGNSKLDDIKKPTSNFTSLETKLGQTKLDDIKRTPIKNILINSVSKLSPVNSDFDTNSILDVYEEDVISEISKLRKEQFRSKLNKSDIEIKPFAITETQFSSNIELNVPEQSFDRSQSSPSISKNDESTNNITDPQTKINVPEQSFDRKEQSPILNSKGLVLPNDDVVNPNIDVSNRPPLFNDLTGQSVIINKDLFSPLNNVIDPEISLQRSTLFFERGDQSPEIDRETEISGLVTDPKIKISKSDLSTNQETDNSDLNINGKVTRYIPISRLASMSTDQIVDTVRYNLVSNQEKDNSELNVDNVIRTNPSGRNEDASKSDYSVNGVQEVNFFKNINANGFTANADLLETEYKGGSKYVWTGKNIPSVNFIQDKNATGFKTFVEPLRTLYLQNTSQFGFEEIPETDFLDIPKKFTITGFKSFSKQYESDYRRDSSQFTWIGKKSASPEVNYFDVSKTYTKAGFHKFAGIYDTKYNTDSSIFNWDGKRESAPVVNYFDIKKNHTKAGFHKFARLYDTQYIPESSIYDWDGDSQDAPSVNYFDLVSKFTTAGFHIFAPFLETMYIPDSSRFDWDGVREQAPFVNYFDVSSKFTTAGFQTFAPFLETKYIPDASVFDWNGTRTLAPEVNYFDISNQYTNAGFHKFASLLDSKYIPESSVYDWNGARVDAPNINYFDLISRFTSEGFHTFAQLYDTKYIPDSSQYDWDGLRLDAPVVDYFDLTKKHTTDGFHKFAVLLDTKYVPESSQFDWDGSKQDAPAINYFDLIKQHTTIGFHTFAQLYDTKYIPEASVFDWNGFRSAAPFVNYFDLSSVKKTTAGFHTFAQLYDTKYVPESSVFDWDGARVDAPVVDYFDLTKKNTTIGFHKFAALYDTKYVPESSVFDWDGARSAAPFVDYFDLTTTKKTTAGFHTFAQLYDTKYVPESSVFDWDGSPRTSLENFVDYFQNTNAPGFTKFAIPLVTEYVKESSRFDWDGSPRTSLENFVDYFQNTNAPGFTKFAIPLVTEYVPESSRFDWDGSPRTSLENFVDYFSNTNAPGFTKFAIPLVTEYVKESSNFDWDGVRTAAPAVDYFDLTKKNTTDGFHTFAELYNTKYVPESSGFDWDGVRTAAPAINYFDLTNKNTTDGFHTFAALYATKYIPESSQFDWDGFKNNAPSVNYFQNTNANGFSTFSKLLETFYKKDTSVFDWDGIRQDAPEVGYFGALVRPNNPMNPITINNLGGLTTSRTRPGFRKFFIDKTQYYLKSEFSFYSTENGPNQSKINGIPLTNFFGFKPEIKTGFMPKMTTYDGTLYPIIDLELKYDYDLIQRNFVETFRNSGGLNLKDREDYAPKGLGKKLWTSGNSTVFASLTNQVPESKIKAESSYYGKPYAKTMKDVTESKGYLAKWAITKNSPSPLDQQYSKYNLQQDAYESGFVGDQPFVVRDIGQKWGFGTTFDEGLIRGGATTMAERAVYDAQRIGKWLISTKGLLWNVKQVGLQLMNPNVDTDPQGGALGAIVDFITTFGMSPTQIFNPLATIVNVAGSAIGLRVPRHSLLGAIDSRSLNKYETSTINRELASPPNDTVVNYFKQLETPTSDGQQTKYSRLIGLMKELLPNSFRTLEPNNVQSSEFLGHSKIHRISTWFGGPNAPLGIGGTKIRRARHPYLTYYTTDGNLPSGFADSTFATPLPGSNNFSAGGALSFLGSSLFNAGSTNPAYPDTARRTQFYNIYDSTGEIPNTYTDVIMRNYNENGRKIFGDIRGLSALFVDGPSDPNSSPIGIVSSSLPNETVGRIVGMNPYKPTRKSLSANLNRITAFNAEGLNLDGIEAYSLTNDDGDAIKKYLTATYSNLRRRDEFSARQGRFTESFSRRFNDFRFDVYDRETDGFVVKNFVSDPDVMGGYYKKRNMETYFGMGEHGAPAADKKLVGKSNVVYNKDATTNASHPVLKTGREFRGDRINILDYKRTTADLTTDLVYEKGAYNNTSIRGTNDLIEFYFTGVNLKAKDGDKVEIIPFRATFGNISDSHNPKWNPIKYMGRGDPLYVYDGYERSISFDFVVHIGSRDEMKASWRKLNYLASWTAPEYTKAGLIKGPLIRLNIGHLYRKLPGFINSLSYTFDNTQTTWETAHLDHDRANIKDAFEDGYPDNYSTPGALQLPKHIAVSVGYTPVGVYRPEYNGIMYQLYDDTGTTPETGLMPDSDDKVNYIRMYDDKPVTGTDNNEHYTVAPGTENKVPKVNPKDRPDVNSDANTINVIDIEA